MAIDNDNGPAVYTEPMGPAEVGAEAIFGDAVAVIAAARMPGAVLGPPVRGAVTLPDIPFHNPVDAPDFWARRPRSFGVVPLLGASRSPVLGADALRMVLLVMTCGLANAVRLGRMPTGMIILVPALWSSVVIAVVVVLGLSRYGGNQVQAKG
jgi:hypothetical protein